MINIKDFESGFLKIDKKHYKQINIYYIGYITIKKNWWLWEYFLCSVNPLHLQVNHANGYIEEKNENKYFVFDDSANENKELLKKDVNVWDGIKNKINDTKEKDYEKDYMKTKFNSDDDLPLNKLLKFHAITIIIRFIFEDGKLYPQDFFDDTLYECTYARIRQNWYFRRNWC